MNREDLSHLSFDSHAPTCMIFNKDLEPNCLQLYMIVRNLTRMNGYCFATNNYLANLFQVDDRTIRRWLQSLIKEGYLDSIVSKGKDAFKSERKIYISDKFKKSLRQDNFVQDPGQKCPPPPDKNVHHKEEYSKEEKKKDSTPSAGASALSTFLHAKIKKMKPNFSKSITPDWYSNADKLLKVRSPDEIRKVIDWAFEDPFWSTVIQSTKSLFKSIDTIEMQMLKKKTGSSALDRFKENSRLADQMRNKFEGHPDIDFGRDYVVFKWGPNSQTPINFSDNGFQEQVINKLRKMCLPIDGLI